MNDAISNQRLVGSHPAVIERANAADTALAAQGMGYRVVEAGRTFAESDADYQKGRNGNPGPIITNAPGGFSWHNFNMAIDVVPFLIGDDGAVDWNATDDHWKALIAALTAAGLPQRGGCKGDADHFELLEIPAVPTDVDRAAFAAGGLPAVWAQYVIS